MRRAGIATALLLSASYSRAWAQQPPAAAPSEAPHPVEPVQPLAPPGPPEASPSTEIPKLTEAAGPPAAQAAVPATASAAATTPQGGWLTSHYDKGFVLVSSPEEGGMPFRLVLNHVSQFKYTNSMATDPTYVDHNGVVHDVQQRNDIQLARDVFYFSGHAFHPRLDYNILIFTSSATLVATAAGYAGFTFTRGFALRAGYFSLPSTRSMTGNYPFFHGTDRSMSTNYFRPGFTQGIWGEGEPLDGFHYLAMLGNSLNTLDIKSANIDNRYAASATVWYDHNDFGKPWNDYEHHTSPAVRVGSAFTFAREDRLSDLAEAGPENNATFISDGLFLFQTGALGLDPNTTISLASFYLWAIDGGIKYKGLAFNVEFYLRWLNNFTSDGPLQRNSMFDWGFDASLGYFVHPKLEVFVRSGLIQGPFATAVEEAVGASWYPFNTRQVWLNAEAVAIKNCPYGGGYYMYSVGQTGFVVPGQFMLRF
jgi:hypothetical protein